MALYDGILMSAQFFPSRCSDFSRRYTVTIQKPYQKANMDQLTIVLII